MKKILISTHSLMAGGVEKSLVSFLNELEQYQDKYEIDLLVPKQEGLFFEQLPSYVNLVNISKGLHCMNYSLFGKKFWTSASLLGILYKIRWYMVYQLLKRKEPGIQQQNMWRMWKRIIPRLRKDYDVAISYTNGPSNYLVIDKVSAKRKILWLHNEYQKVGYNVEFDYKYYHKADKIVTISSSCVDNFVEVFPDLRDKTVVLENISSTAMIHRMSLQKQEDKSFKVDEGRTILLSIGRLTSQKGFDVALTAASIMKKKGISFYWYIIGEGPMHDELMESRKSLRLEEEVIFLGLRKNPYYYIANCNVFVQPSRYEGKSIVLDEAKILCKPILVTNYTTVTDSITNGENGLIVEFDATAIANGLEKIIRSPKLQKKYVEMLLSSKKGNEEEINKYIAIMEEM